MLPRRLALIAALPALATPARAAEPPERHCGDPGGRFIACSAVEATLPPARFDRCPLCGRRHAAGTTP